VDARELVEAALELLWRGDWDAHLQWIEPNVGVAHGHAGWPPRPSLWQRLRGTEDDTGQGLSAYPIAMRPIAEAIAHGPERFQHHVFEPVYPIAPAAGVYEVRVVISGLDLSRHQPRARAWHYHPRVQVGTQQIVFVNLYDGPHGRAKRYVVRAQRP
jgi:hypothetical protein